MAKKPEELRSHKWLGVNDLRSFGHRSRLLQMGYDREDFSGKPVIGILNTWSDINPCHAHFKMRVEEVKRGVIQAGGFPIELPAMTLSEPFQKPTTMLYRNFLAMEAEEGIRSYPVDGVVLMGGCDKTSPALLMGAISADVPTIFMPAGPMLRGNWRGEVLGSGSDTWKYWDEKRAGNITEQDWKEIEGGIARSFGTCMTMGTAATMMSVIEAMGFTLAGASSILAADSGHARMATQTGRRIVDMVWDDLKPSQILSDQSVENGIVVHQAIGGSTNGIIHILAMARRAGLSLDLPQFDKISARVPVIANIRPSGKYLMEDFFYAGGLLALMAELRELLSLDCLTVTGQTLGSHIDGAHTHNADVIRSLDNPVYAQGATAVLYGNLAPSGAVMKPSAADPRFLKHTGPALVFESYDEMKAAIDDDNLDVTPDHVLVLKNAGPHGAPGMPEWGMLPIPKKLVRQGVRDMLRISDARMSGTSYGACVLHVAPEAYIGGPLAHVRTGDLISIDVDARRLDVLIDAAEFARREAAFMPPPPKLARGYGAMFARHVSQANDGCDFDFLEAGVPLPEVEIH
ncbi:L-arabinonate dehydratase [Mariluticola halotolerans]|uniref:L-arabinonate dehydratase n=1 Tax=Mariluticola halotolerans TaxID=2909283 RepID=UPI0026E12D50|nr:L-arabinonate dehydratase [Mariluticola halotolerans]UJQ94704.1 dihydroxy-acid dehydratase [Mariluticola halotolerans]